MIAPNELGTSSRHAAELWAQVACEELDDLVNRLCGIDEHALAVAWMEKHSWKVPPSDSGGTGVGVVGQAAGSGSAAMNGEPERTPAPLRLVTQEE